MTAALGADGEAPSGDASDALQKALAMLARRDYSSRGLVDKLSRKGYSPEAAEAACRRCREMGYVDDRQFGRSRLEARLDRRPAGRRDAERDLRRQGLAGTMIDTVVDTVFAEAGGEGAVLERAFQQWQARHGQPEDLRSAKRCFDHLMRRRFPRHLVLEKLSPWLDELYG